MGACASFPKGMNEEAREAPPPEQPKEEVNFASTLAVAEGNKEIKVNDKGKEEDDKTLGTFLKEEKMEETKTTQTEEEKTLKTEEAVDNNPAVIEAISESSLLVSDRNVERSDAPVAPLSNDANKEITEVKEKTNEGGKISEN